MKILNRHQKELRESAIADSIISLNFTSIKGEDVSENLFDAAFDAIAKESPNSRQYTTAPVKRLLKRYADPIEYGGWWCNGVDPLKEEVGAAMGWGCLKPDRPRKDSSGGKVIKYEHPPKAPTRAFFLRVTYRDGLKIANKAGMGEEYTKRIPTTIPESLPNLDIEDPGFWWWVMEDGVPIMVTEGAKKAASLLSAGYAAIGLPGITGGCRTKDKNGERCPAYLVQELELFNSEGRRTTICFDYETKQRTRKDVSRETGKLSELFVRLGDCRVVNLPGPEKGVDDFLVAFGESQFDQLFAEASDYRFWQFKKSWELTYTRDLNLNQKYLGDGFDYPSSGLCCIKSPKGTGKTKKLEAEIEKARGTGRPVLVITHRIELGRAICEAIGINWIEDCKGNVEGKLFGYGLCVDSLHPLSQASFDPDAWEDAIVIIDEVEQVLWHLMNSTTCIEKRAVILKTFEKLIKNVLASEEGLVILQDADLSDYSIDYLLDISGVDGLKPVVIENIYRENCRDVYFYQHAIEAIFNELDSQINQGKNVLIVEDSKREKSRFSCINMESQIKKRHPNARILRIDSETVADPNHPAFACAKNIDLIVKSYDVVIASPTIGTGVSIDLKGHFASVFGIFKGAIGTNDVLQMMSRLRDLSADWHLWTARYGCSKIGNGCSSAYPLLEGKDKVTRRNLDLLGKVDGVNGFDFDSKIDPKNTRFWAKMGARINAGQWDFRRNIYYLLQQEGHRVILSNDTALRHESVILSAKHNQAYNNGDVERACEIDNDLAKVERQLEALDFVNKVLKKEATAVRDENRMINAEAICAAPVADKARYEKLQEKKAKTPDEVREERRYYLADTYRISVTPCLVIKDEDGWLRQIRLHYYLLNPLKATERDNHHLLKSEENGEGLITLQDLKFYSARVKILQVLGVLDLLNGEEYTSDSPEILGIQEKLFAARQDIRDFLGITPSDKKSPMRLINELLDATIGATLKGRVVRQGKDTTRVYSFQGFTDGRSEVFEEWDKICQSEQTNEGIDVAPEHNRRLDILVQQPNNVVQQPENPVQQPSATTPPVEVEEAAAGSWKGWTGQIKAEVQSWWIEVYDSFSASGNRLLEATGKAFKVIGDIPTWKHNALAPNGGGWALLGYIEGQDSAIPIPIECLEGLEGLC